MPSNVVKSFATKTGKSVSEVEALWDKAKKLAAEQGHTEDYDYITGILKKMLGLSERVTLEQFLNSDKSFHQLYEDAQASSSFTSITPTNPYKKDMDEEDKEFVVTNKDEIE